MANTNTTTAAKWVDQHWEDIDVLAYEEMVGIPLMMESPKSPHGQLHVPYMANIGTVTVAAGSAGTMTASANTESEATFSPTTYACIQDVELPLIVRAVQDPTNKLKEGMGSAIAQALDVAALTTAASLTQIVAAAGNVGFAEILDAYQKGAAGAKSKWRPGKTVPSCILHVSQIDDLMSILNLTSAQIRGDSANPMVVGWVFKALGIDFYESGNVYSTGGVASNVMLIPSAFRVAWNQRPQTLVQEYQLLSRIIVWSDAAFGIARDPYAVQITSPSS